MTKNICKVHECNVKKIICRPPLFTKMSTEIDSLDKNQMKTFSDFLLSYNKLSELCFSHCVNDFTARAIQTSEDRCALNCMEKYLKMNQRISQRFQEFQMLANENAAALLQKTG